MKVLKRKGSFMVTDLRQNLAREETMNVHFEAYRAIDILKKHHHPFWLRFIGLKKLAKAVNSIKDKPQETITEAEVYNICYAAIHAKRIQRFFSGSLKQFTKTALYKTGKRLDRADIFDESFAPLMHQQGLYLLEQTYNMMESAGLLQKVNAKQNLSLVINHQPSSIFQALRSLESAKLINQYYFDAIMSSPSKTAPNPSQAAALLVILFNTGLLHCDEGEVNQKFALSHPHGKELAYVLDSLHYCNKLPDFLTMQAYIDRLRIQSSFFSPYYEDLGRVPSNRMVEVFSYFQHMWFSYGGAMPTEDQLEMRSQLIQAKFDEILKRKQFAKVIVIPDSKPEPLKECSAEFGAGVFNWEADEEACMPKSYGEFHA